MNIRNAARVAAGTLSLCAMWAAFICYMGSIAPTLDADHHLVYAGLAVCAATGAIVLGYFALKEPT